MTGPDRPNSPRSCEHDGARFDAAAPGYGTRVRLPIPQPAGPR